MRIVTLEEHVTFPEIVAQLPRALTETQHASPQIQKLAPLLADVTEQRLQSMNAAGISHQVISVAGPGADLLDSDQAPTFSRRYNDAIAEQITVNRDRFSAFAHLPTPNPEAAATELERTVKEYGFVGALINGLTHEEFLDDPKYAPIFEKAQSLDVPIYLHPNVPPKAVKDAYYSNLPKASGELLSIAGWGWHSETALHVLRLIVSGIFDQYPKLKLIIGHMGEMLPMMMARCDNMFQPGTTGLNQRTISQTLCDQVWITTSGLFTAPPLRAAIDTFGIDHVLFSVDYPFSTNEKGREFLDSLSLNHEELAKLTHLNADKLLKLKA